MKFELRMVHSDPKRFAETLRELADDIDAGGMPNNCVGDSANGVTFDFHFLESDDLWENAPDVKVVDSSRLRFN